jgi:hypothetical protein
MSIASNMLLLSLADNFIITAIFYELNK